MSEEEKKAIEELSKKAVFCNYEERDYPNMICFKKDMLIVLNLIEKQQKQIEYDKTHILTPQTIDLNFIPKSKIEEKIEELEEKMRYEDNEKVLIQLHKQRRVLQELLDNRK